MTSTSNSCFFVIVIVLAAFALANGKDAVKNEDLAAQLKEARQESAELRQKSEELSQISEELRQESAELRQELYKSKEETKMIIERENKRLTAEATKLRAEDTKLRAEATKLRAEDTKLRREAAKLRKANKKLQRQDEELRQRDAELERKVNELHRDNSEVKKTVRQRNENNSLELQNVVQSSFREMDSSSEFTKIVYKKIKEYLNDNKMCVAGSIAVSLSASVEGYKGKDSKIEFGQTFQRIPAFAAALSLVNLKTTSDQAPNAFCKLSNFRVTDSSAVIHIYGYDCYGVWVTWIACL